MELVHAVLPQVAERGLSVRRRSRPGAKREHGQVGCGHGSSIVNSFSSDSHRGLTSGG
jgi:hypothetical protein